MRDLFAGGDIEGLWAGRLLALVRAKAQLADITAWMETNGIAALLGGPSGALKVRCRCMQLLPLCRMPSKR